MKPNSFEKIPDAFFEKWQEIADLIGNIMDIPAPLIMKVENELMEVLISGNTGENPYKAGDKEHWHGLYCETVIKTQKKLSIANALKNKKWDKNPDIKLGMIAYLGFPINFPDQEPFGTICVLDNKERTFSADDEKLLLQFKKAIELDLALISSLDFEKITSENDVFLKLMRSNEEYLLINEEYLAANEELKEAYDELLRIKQITGESEEKMRSIYRVAPVGIGVVVNRVLKEVNPRICEMTGYTRDELIDKDALTLYPTLEDYELVGKEKYEQIRAKGTGEVESLWQKKDGTVINVLLASTPLDVNDFSKGVTFTALDITQRKKAEEALRKSEAIKNKMVSNIGDVIVIIDKNEINQYKSPNITTLFGWQPEELVGKSSWDQIHPDDVEAGKKFIRTLLHKPNATGTTQVRYRRKDGRYVWIEITLVNLLHDSDINGFLGNYYDISERKRADQILRESEEMLRNSQSLAHICAYSTNLNLEELGKSTWKVSPEFYKIFGIDETYPHTLEGWAGFIHPDHREAMFAYHQYVVKEKIPFNKEYKIIRINDGAERWVHGTGELVYNETGEPVRMHGAIQDITGRKEIEQMLKEKNEEYESINEELKQTNDELFEAKEKAEESDRLKSSFLANMSHEIRTPMNGILGFVELMKRPELKGDRRQNYIALIEKSGERMLSIINDIIDISKIEVGLKTIQISESNINEQIEYIFTFFKPEVEAKGLELSFKTPLTAKESTIETDREKVYAILTNLVKNAIKYSKEGEIEIGYLKKGDFLEFYVKDTGVGISEERHETIFERFIQGGTDEMMARQGAGLGLAISKAYVEMLGGEIWVESKEGTGSTFCFTLPYKTKTKENTRQKDVHSDGVKNEQASAVSGLKILIAEDDEISEILLVEVLNSLAGDIVNARTGLDAVDACREHRDIDLVLMDIQMPEMNGYEATKKIREFNKDVVIIAQTAYGLSGDREKSIEAGCNDYISKPISQDKLIALIEKYFME
ncbi:MAG: PAS domain S-box protein [Marinilabilia sp.]